jgi:hypothetical protein
LFGLLKSSAFWEKDAEKRDYTSEAIPVNRPATVSPARQQWKITWKRALLEWRASPGTKRFFAGSAAANHAARERGFSRFIRYFRVH